MPGICRSVTIISENAIRAVKPYLNAHDLARIGSNVLAREAAGLSDVRPATRLIERAASGLNAVPSSCTLVCTTVEAIEAAEISGAYARTSNDYDRLASAGAGVIITSLAHLDSDSARETIAAANCENFSMQFLFKAARRAVRAAKTARITDPSEFQMRTVTKASYHTQPTECGGSHR